MTTDRLPPHSVEGEQGVLGCCLLDPACIDKAQEKFRGIDEVFFDLRHRLIWQCVCALRADNIAIDNITVVDRLRSGQKLEQIGGPAYLLELPDKTPSAAHLQEYLEIVWEKHLARQLIRNSVNTVQRIYEVDGLTESLLVEHDLGHAAFKKMAEGPALTPRHLADPGEFGEEFFGHWFRHKTETYGWDLHFPLADLRVRPHELTLITADNGAGKSTHLGQLAICLGVQGIRTCIASLEVPAATTLWILSRQLLGAQHAHMEETDENKKLLVKALAWMQTKIRFYNFLGIGNWRDILAVFRYAREHMGWEVFILDSALKIGIPDDDFSQQALAANAFSDFCVTSGAHMFLVVHQNKAEGANAKKKVRGSGAWTDAAHVVLSLRRNEKKDELLEKVDSDDREVQAVLDNPSVSAEDVRQAQARRDKINMSRAELRHEWDSELRLLKQRWPGAKYQNASRRVYFHRPSLQFGTKPDTGPINYMES
jgi:hypothetical protein